MMNKKLFSSLLIGGLLFSFTGGFVSCSEDYDDDIKGLQAQIDAQRASLAEIETLLQSGVVIKDVKSDTNGIKLTLSNGNEYVLTHGEDGKDGKDAAVWTIGTDGYWYLNNEKTEYKAIGIDGVDGKDGKDGVDGKDGKDGADGKDGKDGADGKDGINGTNGKDGADGKDGINGTDGKDGADGKDGVDGKDGENGYYYVPNTETGMFDIYQVKDGVGTFVKATEISWRAQCMSAVFTGNKLILTGIKGAENESVTLYVGTGLGSVAFIPEVYSQDFFLPTPKTEYMHINSYGKLGDKDAGKELLKAKTDIEYSNLVTLSYRLNPSDAFVENTNFGFISRSVITRASGDKSGNSARIGQVGEATIANGEVNLVTRYNRAGQGNIVALQTWVGQDVVTSDYIYVGSSKGIDVEIRKTQQPSLAQYVQRTKNGQIYDVNANTRKSDYIQENFLPLDANGNENHNLELKMDETHNLNEYVDLYISGTTDKLTAKGFDGNRIRYEFAIEEYKDGATDQAQFATLDGSNISVGGAIGGTSAETRTPVVRVDAYITDYNDAERLVASAYIKIKWVKEIKKDTPDDAYPTIDLGSSNHVYQTLGSTAKQIYEMPWTKVNTDLYNKAGLNATNFWNYYNTPTYKVTVNDVDKSYKPVQGVTVSSNLANAATATSAFSIALDNKVLTENTYNKRGAAAEYTVTIFIESKDDYDGKGDFTLVYKFNVSENCEAFELNPNMAVGNTVTVNGTVGATGWEMRTDVAQHFKYNAAHEDIFTYYTEHKNVKAGSLEFSENMANVDMSGDYKQMWLNTAISKDVEVPVKYSVELENGEVCEYSYTVVFENPFVGTTGNAVTVSQKPGVNLSLIHI